MARRKQPLQRIEDVPVPLSCRKTGCKGSIRVPSKELDGLTGFECPECRAYWPLTNKDKLLARSGHVKLLNELAAQGRIKILR